MARRQRGGGRRQAKRDTWEVEGVVEEIAEKKWNRKLLYTVYLEGEDDGIGTGEEDYGLEEGDEVVITVYENDKGYLNAENVEIVGDDSGKSKRSSGRGGNGRTSTRKGSTSRSSGRTKKDSDGPKTQDLIHYQNSRTAAQETLHFLVGQEIISLGAKNKKAEREAAYWGLLDKFTAMFMEEIPALAAVSRAAEAASGGDDDPDNGDDPDGGYDD